MRKWRTLLAGLVLTFAVSAMAACGTNNDNVNDTKNGTGTESTIDGTGTGRWNRYNQRHEQWQCERYNQRYGQWNRYNGWHKRYEHR